MLTREIFCDIILIDNFSIVQHNCNYVMKIIKMRGALIMGLDKDLLIKNMTDNLPMLRTRLDLSQEELANKIGLSRSTVFAMESHRSKMTWNTFLSLVLLFIKNKETNKLLGVLEIYTDELNDFLKENVNNNQSQTEILDESVLSKLDDKALVNVKKLIIEEYARCNSASKDDVIKFFEGNKFLSANLNDEDKVIRKAIDNIKRKE